MELQDRVCTHQEIRALELSAPHQPFSCLRLRVSTVGLVREHAIACWWASGKGPVNVLRYLKSAGFKVNEEPWVCQGS